MIYTRQTGYEPGQGFHCFVESFSPDKAKDLPAAMKRLAGCARMAFKEYGLWPTIIVIGDEVKKRFPVIEQQASVFDEKARLNMVRGDLTAPRWQVIMGILREDVLAGKKHSETDIPDLFIWAQDGQVLSPKTKPGGEYAGIASLPVTPAPPAQEVTEETQPEQVVYIQTSLLEQLNALFG